MKKANRKKVIIDDSPKNPITYRIGLSLLNLSLIVFESTADGIIAWATRSIGPVIIADAKANVKNVIDLAISLHSPAVGAKGSKVIALLMFFFELH